MTSTSKSPTAVRAILLLALASLAGCGAGPESEQDPAMYLYAGGRDGGGTGGSSGSPIMNNGNVTQSSTAFGGIAERATDGNTDGNFWNGSVSHTDYQFFPFWQTETRPEFPGKVTIHRRTDCCPEQLGTFRLSFYSLSANTWLDVGTYDLGTQNRLEVPITNPTFWGRIGAVRITKLDWGYLTLAEVTVERF